MRKPSAEKQTADPHMDRPLRARRTGRFIARICTASCPYGDRGCRREKLLEPQIRPEITSVGIDRRIHFTVIAAKAGLGGTVPSAARRRAGSSSSMKLAPTGPKRATREDLHHPRSPAQIHPARQ